jgi:hypothetical protein
MSDKKYVFVQVTFTEDYFIPMINDDKTEINGWSLSEVIKDWFLNYASFGFHATRNGHCIGNSKKYVSSKVVGKYPKEED